MSRDGTEPRYPAVLATHLAQGEAALMLVECLMLMLTDRGMMSIDEMTDAIETVIATKRQMVADHEHAQIAAAAVGLLGTIANSLASNKAPRHRDS